MKGKESRVVSNLFRPDPEYAELLEALNRLVSQDLAQRKKSQILKDLQEYCLEDLFFLAKYVLGCWWLCADPDGPHREFAHEIQKDVHLTLYLLPRGHCKTKLFSIADTIRHAIREPGNPIALGSETRMRASRRLREIKSHYKSNRVFRNIFFDRVWNNPESKRENPLWGTDEIHLPGFTMGNEAAVTAFGLEAMPTGSHYPRIKMDDLVVPENTTTADQIKKTKDQYGLVRSSILTTYGNAQICGTIYDDGDLHRDMENSGDYRVYKRAAEWTEQDGHGVIKRRTLWPVQYGTHQLDAIKKDPMVGLYIYSCQYLLDPAPEDQNAFFQLKWFGRYKAIPKGLIYFAAGDLAISEAETSADTAIVVGGVDVFHELYLVHVRYGHWDALQIIDQLIDVQALWKPGIFTIEAENISRTIMPFLGLKMRETGIFLNVDTRLPQGDKVAKARPFQGRAREGAVHLPAKGKSEPDWLFDTEFQLRRFPRGKKKDIVDSAALLCHQLASQWRPATEQERKEQAADEYVPLDVAAGY
ncbi:MAG: hypothetical protein WC241_04085 [Candidatus Paceibacterota bacterium]|jgi:phage terminase large subunit-like protein